jgi:hypothetical protein
MGQLTNVIIIKLFICYYSSNSLDTKKNKYSDCELYSAKINMLIFLSAVIYITTKHSLVDNVYSSIRY